MKKLFAIGVMMVLIFSIFTFAEENDYMDDDWYYDSRTDIGTILETEKFAIAYLKIGESYYGIEIGYWDEAADEVVEAASVWCIPEADVVYSCSGRFTPKETEEMRDKFNVIMNDCVYEMDMNGWA